MVDISNAVKLEYFIYSCQMGTLYFEIWIDQGFVSQMNVSILNEFTDFLNFSLKVQKLFYFTHLPVSWQSSCQSIPLLLFHDMCLC